MEVRGKAVELGVRRLRLACSVPSLGLFCTVRSWMRWCRGPYHALRFWGPKTTSRGYHCPRRRLASRLKPGVVQHQLFEAPRLAQGV